jgi:hypothetical protein
MKAVVLTAPGSRIREASGSTSEMVAAGDVCVRTHRGSGGPLAFGPLGREAIGETQCRLREASRVRSVARR